MRTPECPLQIWNSIIIHRAIFIIIDMELHSLLELCSTIKRIMELQMSILERHNYGDWSSLTLHTTKQNKNKISFCKKHLTTTFHFLPLFSICILVRLYTWLILNFHTFRCQWLLQKLSYQYNRVSKKTIQKRQMKRTKGANTNNYKQEPQGNITTDLHSKIEYKDII